MKHLLILFTCLLSLHSKAQGGVMLEAGGPAGYGSLNFTTTGFNIGPSGILDTRIGYGTYRFTGIKGNFHPDLIIPIGLSYSDERLHRLGLGFGVTFSGIQQFRENDLKTIWTTTTFEELSFKIIARQKAVLKISGYVLNEKQKSFRPWGGLSYTYFF